MDAEPEKAGRRLIPGVVWATAVILLR